MQFASLPSHLSQGLNENHVTNCYANTGGLIEDNGLIVNFMTEQAKQYRLLGNDIQFV